MMDEIQVTVAKGGFSLMGFTVSGSLPLHNLTHNGQSVFVLGLRWFFERDFFKFNIGELKFSPNRRGRKV